jgi:plasmid stability protein
MRRSQVRNLTIRNIPDEVADALENEKSRRRASLNGTVIELLRQGLGVGSSPRSNGIRRLAGTWTAEQLQEFEENVAVLDGIDAELWR